MYGFVVGDFGDNGSCKLSFSGGCPKSWNTTVPGAFEYEHSLQDETLTRTMFNRLTFEVTLYDTSE